MSMTVLLLSSQRSKTGVASPENRHKRIALDLSQIECNPLWTPRSTASGR
jgi:hypothetical protein